MAVGVVIGLTASVALGSALARWSITNMDDPLILAAVAGALVVTTLAAALIPARRAIAIEPVIALRTE